ncbi:Rhomboid protease GluP [Phycisphaerae bacterium RAS2]|nr:Rhomboid protease GluP [Phycisphaerae bacterium RAS2]
MALKVKCKCGTMLKVPSAMADKRITCPGCQKGFILPAAKFAAMGGAAKPSAAPTRAATASPASSQIAPAPVTHAASPPADSPESSRLALGAGTEPTELDLTPSNLDSELVPSSADLLSDLALSESNAVAELSLAEPAPVLRNDPLAEMPSGPEKTCRSCGKSYPNKAKICVPCGIDLKTGRSLLTAEDSHIDSAYIAAEKTINIISWIFWLGLYPIASEAFGTKKPQLIRGVAIFTILTSFWFFVCEWTDSPKMHSLKNAMLWSGNAQPDPNQILALYATTSFGNSEAFFDKLDRFEEEDEEAYDEDEVEDDEADSDSGESDHESAADDESAELDSEESDEEPGLNSASSAAAKSLKSSKSKDANREMPPEMKPPAMSFEDAVFAAHNALPESERCIGQFHWWQTITNAFFHADLLHLASNLLFLLVFGCRVNALIGTAKSAIVYPILAVAGSVAHMISASDQPPHPLLGASGAIMGLSGMYLVFFPVHKVHVAAWVRLGLMFGFRLKYQIYERRGFWVVLFYIAFDVFYTVFRIEDNVAHWAHLGGFICGMVVALILLITRQVNARGGDIFSVMLGQRAWALIGKPR